MPGCFTGFKRVLLRRQPAIAKLEESQCRPLPELGLDNIQYSLHQNPVGGRLPCVWDEKLGAPPSYQATDLDDEYRPEVLETIKESVSVQDEGLRNLALSIHGTALWKYQL